MGGIFCFEAGDNEYRTVPVSETEEIQNQPCSNGGSEKVL